MPFPFRIRLRGRERPQGHRAYTRSVRPTYVCSETSSKTGEQRSETCPIHAKQAFRFGRIGVVGASAELTPASVVVRASLSSSMDQVARTGGTATWHALRGLTKPRDTARRKAPRPCPPVLTRSARGRPVVSDVILRLTPAGQRLRAHIVTPAGCDSCPPPTRRRPSPLATTWLCSLLQRLITALLSRAPVPGARPTWPACCCARPMRVRWVDRLVSLHT
jgi:hypothetical protein